LVTNGKILFESDREMSKAALVVEHNMEENDFIEHIVPGSVIKASPDGKNIVYRLYEQEGLLDNRFGIYNVNTRTSHEIIGTPGHYLFNNSDVTWNESGTKIAFLGIDFENKQEKHTLLVYDLLKDHLTLIPEPDSITFQAGLPDNIQFESDTVIYISGTNFRIHLD
jgi:hypothetical protein